MKTSPESRSTPLGSLTRSPEREPPTNWEANWILLRNLWPDWTPTDEQIREVWFRAFDKIHGVSGAKRINQDALREAILAVARSKRFKDPVFIDISDAYRHETNRVHAEIQRARSSSRTTDEQVKLNEEAIRMRDQITDWSAERLIAARQLVEKKVVTFVGKSTNPETWSRVYIGCLIAADEELREEADE